MIAALRAEWIKLTTVTSSWVLVILAFAIPLVVITLTGVFASGTADGDELAELIVGVGVLSSLLLGALSAMSITSETSTNTIRPTFAALPDRWRPLLAKPILHVSLTAITMVAVVVLCWIVGSGLIEGDQPLDVPGVTASLAGLVVLGILLTLFGYALGLLVRSTALAIIILLLWPLLAEGIIAGLFTVAGWDGAVKWLPYQAGFNLIDVHDFDGDDSLSRVVGGAWFALWIAVLLALGLWRTTRRDA